MRILTENHSFLKNENSLIKGEQIANNLCRKYRCLEKTAKSSFFAQSCSAFDDFLHDISKKIPDVIRIVNDYFNHLVIK